jgi:exonuclease III
LHINIRGLFNNFTDIEAIFGNHQNIDIFLLSETHISPCSYNNNSKLYDIPGYTFIHKSRENTSSGGVAAYVSDRLNWQRREDLEGENIECIFIEITNKNTKSFLVGGFYRPPEGSRYLPKNFNELLRNVLIKINELSCETILMGDLNVNYLKSSKNKDLKQLIAAQGFDQLINKATRVTKDTSTLIDIILTNKKENISISNVFPIGISDHDMIGCVRKLNHRKYKPRTITCRNFTTYEPVKMNEELSAVNFDELYNCRNVNYCWEFFKTELLKVYDPCPNNKKDSKR